MIKKQGLTKYDQETIILFNEDEDTAKVYTYNKSLKRQLKRLECERDDISQTKDDGTGGLTFAIPRIWIKIRPSRIVPPEEKQKRAEQMKKNKAVKC